jgi:hypothetical protein
MIIKFLSKLIEDEDFDSIDPEFMIDDEYWFEDYEYELHYISMPKFILLAGEDLYERVDNTSEVDFLKYDDVESDIHAIIFYLRITDMLVI